MTRILVCLILIATTACSAKKFEAKALASQGSLMGPAQMAQAKIKIVDTSGAVRAGVNVTGVWSGVVSGTTTAVTGADGVATLVSPPSTDKGDYTVAVTTVVESGRTYDASKNKVGQASVTRQ
jgi:hypothetical protein